MTMVKWCVLAIWFSGIALAGSAQHTLSVAITDIRQSDGKIYLALYKGADAWLQAEKVYLTDTIAVRGDGVQLQYTNLPPGDYGIALLHDRDGDAEMSYNWLGVPVEGHGFSGINNRITSEPGFNDCKFAISAPTHIIIDLIHWL